jgi:NAD(P)-dependent dehydrogenase (short-subunit alcohol dehydrogenase family)
MFELTGKTALVTGGAKRIGKAIAVGLAKQGANIIIHYGKSENEARKLQDEIVELGRKSWIVSADLGNPESCKELIAQACRSSGGIDVLVNNASVFSANDVNDVRLEDIEVNMLINAWAPFLLTRYFSEKTDHGKVVNILDTRVAGYDFNHFAYYLSKRMLEILTRSMALKLAPNITVNAIAPGLILPPEGKDYAYLEQKKDTVPLKKYGSVSDIVETVIFLLRSDFVTGQIVYVDGGKHLTQTIEGL